MDVRICPLYKDEKSVQGLLTGNWFSTRSAVCRECCFAYTSLLFVCSPLRCACLCGVCVWFDKCSMLDSSYVSSLSWYFIVMFGLRGFLSLFMSDDGACVNTPHVHPFPSAGMKHLYSWCTLTVCEDFGRVGGESTYLWVGQRACVVRRHCLEEPPLGPEAC